MNQYLKDILAQAKVLRHTLGLYKSADCQKTLEAIRSLQMKRIVFLGMGSSNYSVLPASILLNQAGFYSRLESASQFLHYEFSSLRDDDLLVIISQSGESAEIVELIKRLPVTRPLVAICNFPESTLAKRASHLLLMQVEPEEAASTRTYLASVVLSQMLAHVLCNNDLDKFFAEVEKALAAMDSLLLEYAGIKEKLYDFLTPVQTIALMSRGYALGTARAGALFIREAAKFPALDFESAEFRHGPFEIVDYKLCALIFAPEGPTYDLQLNLAQDIINRGGKVVFICSKNKDPALQGCLVIETGELSEPLSALAQIIPLQIITCILAEQGGFEPGVFRWSSKVTVNE